MRKIKLTRGQYALVDNEDYELLSSFNWQATQSSNNKTFYARRNNGYGKNKQRLKVSMHRQIMNFPIGSEVDHINGNTLDNRKCNLRICTHSQNVQSQKDRGGKSKYRGVTKHIIKHQLKSGEKIYSNGWRARISVNYKRICLGVYKTQKQAYQAVLNAQRKYYD